MLFNSVSFLVFLSVVLAIYHCLSHRAQNYFLLVASYAFYGWWDYRYLALVWAITIIAFYVGAHIQANDNPVRRRIFLLAGLVPILAILGFFKYYNFFVSSFSRVAVSLGFSPSVTVLQIILPVGISFYTFQSLGYIIDVYRKKIEAHKDFLTFALFSCYFPILLAGPIERAKNLLPRIENTRIVTVNDFQCGLQLMLLGYVKKVVIADSVAPYVSSCFQHPGEFGGINLLLGAYLFTLQIYGDFSGYSDIARGVSRLFGIELMVNFRQPYFSANIQEFWQRWHISLSTWLRDYLYIPLGGNRKGRIRTYINLMVTMLLGGLWHGASMHFVIWGGLHGFYLSVHRIFSQRNLSGRNQPAWRKLMKVFVTFHFVTFAWIFFKASTLSEGVGYVKSMSSSFGSISLSLLLLTVCFSGLACLVDLPMFKYDREYLFTGKENYLLRGTVYAVLLLSIFYVGENSAEPFIYFKF